VDKDVFALVDCGPDSVLKDVLEGDETGHEDLVVEILGV